MAGFKFGGSTIAASVSSAQPIYVTKSPINEKVPQGIQTLPFLCIIPSAHFESKDDGTCQTFVGGMNHLHPRDTGRTLFDSSSAKIWGMYLSRAARLDKVHSDIWIGNTDSVLVFVHHKSWRLYCPYPGRSSDWSFLCCGSCVPHCQLSTFTAQSNQYHQSATYPNLMAVIK
jgi:hypothetical protein